MNLKSKLLAGLSATMLLMATTSALAAPFLVTNPVFEATGIVLNMDGSAVNGTLVQNSDGSVSLHYDLAALAAGSHTAYVQADYGKWGVGDTSDPFSFTKPDVTAKLTLTIE